jgi:simple sugar transport system permease protein
VAVWLLPVAAALVVGALLLLLAGAPPLDAFRLIAQGAFGDAADTANTLMAWVPLVLAAAGLCFTFAAGLWNIGIDGQITFGAIAAAAAARLVPGPSLVVIPAVVLAGVVGGALWGMAAGLLRTHGGVNEIFGGLGLDFVARGLAIYLIIGPWQREGVASTSGTEPFRDEAWLPTVGGTNLSILALVVAVAALVVTGIMLRNSRFGLELKAVGKGPASAALLGVDTRRRMLGAFLICGGMAGIAGAVQAIGFHHKLVPAVSGGYGFLALLVVLLVDFRQAWIAPVALFFAAIFSGSTQLQLQLDIDSSLGGVLQGVLVLLVLLTRGWQQRRGHGEVGAAGEVT